MTDRKILQPNQYTEVDLEACETAFFRPDGTGEMILRGFGEPVPIDQESAARLARDLRMGPIFVKGLEAITGLTTSVELL